VEDDYYTTGEASRLLRVSEERVRQLLASGELAGDHDPITERWRVFKPAIHARREQRRPSEPSRMTGDTREWVDRIAKLEKELGRLEGEMRARAELTELTVSTLKVQLQRERERTDRLETELRQERSKGFWERLFG